MGGRRRPEQSVGVGADTKSLWGRPLRYRCARVWIRRRSSKALSWVGQVRRVSWPAGLCGGAGLKRSGCAAELFAQVRDCDDLAGPGCPWHPKVGSVVLAWTVGPARPSYAHDLLSAHSASDALPIDS